MPKSGGLGKLNIFWGFEASGPLRRHVPTPSGRRVQRPQSGQRVQRPQSGQRVQRPQSGQRAQRPQSELRVQRPRNGPDTVSSSLRGQCRTIALHDGCCTRPCRNCKIQRWVQRPLTRNHVVWFQRSSEKALLASSTRPGRQNLAKSPSKSRRTGMSFLSCRKSIS